MHELFLKICPNMNGYVCVENHIESHNLLELVFNYQLHIAVAGLTCLSYEKMLL